MTVALIAYRQLSDAQGREHRPAVHDVEVVRDGGRPPPPVRPGREHGDRPAAGAVDHRIAELSRRAGDDGLRREALLDQHIFG